MTTVYFRKIMVLTIICLFIVAGVFPAFGITIKNGACNINIKEKEIYFRNAEIDTILDLRENIVGKNIKIPFYHEQYFVGFDYSIQNDPLFNHDLPVAISKENKKNILWNYSDDASIPIVTICDSGKFIWVGQWLNNERFQLFDTTGSGMPEWEYESPDESDIWLVGSSAESKVLAGVAMNYKNESSTLYKWDVSSNIPRWCYDLPDGLFPCGLCVSNDGGRIILATCNYSQQISNIFIFDSDSNIPSLIYPISTEYPYVDQLDISDDGSIVLISLDLEAIVIDVNTKEIRWRETESPAAISGDGSVLVYQSWDYGHFLTVLKWNAIENKYIEQWNKKFSIEDWFICINCHTLEVSDDGSTIMVGVDYVDYLQNKVVMFDVNSGDLLWEHYSTGLGEYQNTVSEICLSYNGSIGIVAYRGDELNTVPELKLFGRDSPIPIFCLDSSGSMMSVDVSSDGKFAVGGCKMVHANEWGYGGVIYAIEIEDILNTPPITPSKPSGPKSGKAGTSYSYSSSTTDPDGDQIWYKWDWGDETSGWDGPYDSGDTATASHVWDERGDYNIKVKAKDVHDEESPWSNQLAITMPKNKIINPFGRILENHPNLFPLLRQIFGL